MRMRSSAASLSVALVLATSTLIVAAAACGLDAAGVGASNGAPGGPSGGDASSDVLGAQGDDATSSGDDGSTTGDTGATGDDGSTTGNDAAGNDAGAGCAACGAQHVCAANVCVPARRVFVSSMQSNGNLGGPTGADTTCQNLANAASLGGTWKAWISDDATSPSARFTQSTDPYALLDGRVLALNWTALTSATSLVNPFDLDEKKKPVPNDTEVWTGTRRAGTSLTGCTGFTTSGHNDDQPFVGRTGRTDQTWSEFTTNVHCDENKRIYCFEQ